MNRTKAFDVNVLILVVLLVDVIGHCERFQSQLRLGLQLVTSYIFSCTPASTFALAGALGSIAVFAHIGRRGKSPLDTLGVFFLDEGFCAVPLFRTHTLANYSKMCLLVFIEQLLVGLGLYERRARILFYSDVNLHCFSLSCEQQVARVPLALLDGAFSHADEF